MLRLRNRLLPMFLAVAGTVAFAACDNEPTDPSAANRGLIDLVVSAEVDTADNARVDTITAFVDTRFKSANATVEFTTSASAFSTGATATTVQVKPDSLGAARAFLRAPSERTVAFVTATVAGMTKTRRIDFVPAEPTRLILTASQYVLEAKPGAAVAVADINVSLLRTRGTVTPGGTIRFEAVGQGTDFGRLSVDTTVASSTGAASRYFLLTTGIGTVTIRATYERDGHTLRDSVEIRVITAR